MITATLMVHWHVSLPDTFGLNSRISLILSVVLFQLMLVLLAVFGLIIYLPYLGAYPFWDPWEPHYTQVAWEMQDRDTWWRPWYR